MCVLGNGCAMQRVCNVWRVFKGMGVQRCARVGRWACNAAGVAGSGCAACVQRGVCKAGSVPWSGV